MTAHSHWRGEKRVSLALQGGGSHGAFTWGVLDEILADGRLDIEAITGTSAGAMNAVVLAQGMLEDGREGARAQLEKFWFSVSESSSLSAPLRALVDQFFKGWNIDGSPVQVWLDFVTHYASPYEFNPLNINPLRDHLVRMVDFEKVRSCKEIALFVAATNVNTGHIAIFDRDVLTADHVLASACLPFVFQAVEIDGAPFWDGGYLGNPALFPLFYKTACPDIVIVQVNPIEREGTPRTAREIQNRLNEITFNGALLGELRAIDFVNRLVDSGKLSRDAYMRPFVHRIDGAEPLKAFSSASRLSAAWSFLQELRDIGRAAARDWLATHYDAIGQRGTLDLRMAFSTNGTARRSSP
ncbi:MAG: patatin-like phospholipase family protein [Beijerinckiaceae bacterium]|nr:patatin-like phospholipase family protein [Beijerinckiaceae bacterium]